MDRSELKSEPVTDQMILDAKGRMLNAYEHPWHVLQTLSGSHILILLTSSNADKSWMAKVAHLFGTMRASNVHLLLDRK